MRKIKLYIATSLDGKIAAPDGSVSWLESILNPEQTDYGYQAFYDSIDTTLMGYSTYQAIEGFAGPFPYTDKENFVFTRKPAPPPAEHVTFVQSEIPSFLNALKEKPGKDIWLIGGGKFAGYLIGEQLVDEMMLFVMPILLGEGIPLFEAAFPQTSLVLLDELRYQNGVKMLHYAIGR